MKKRGFTLVELLAVISILAILIIIAMPNILKIFRESKQKSFHNEVETIKNEIKKEVFNASLSNQPVPGVISSIGDYQLDLDGREINYYAELDRHGNLLYLEVNDGDFYYQFTDDMGNEGEIVDLEKNNPDSKLEYIMDNVSTEQIFVYDTLYDIYDETNSIPVIMTNMSEQEVKFSVIFNNINVSNEFVVPPKTEDYMIFVKLPKTTIDSMNLNSIYNLKIETTVNIGKDLANDDIIVKYNYANKVKIRRVNPGIVISNVSSSTGNLIEFNQTGIFVPKNVNVGVLSVSIKNLSNITYKFKNIFRDELVMKVDNINDKIYKSVTLSESELQKYQNYLNGGVYFYNYSDNVFDMDFGSKNNIQKIHFDFDVHINPGVVNDGELTIASKENSSPVKFGDFYPMSKDDANDFHGVTHCSLNDCFGFEKFNYDSDSALKLDVKEGIPILDIAQSMGINNTFSIYTTVLPDTLNQVGKPTGDFPGTILAISQDYGIYLAWIGIYKNYLHVYSYHQGNSYSKNNFYTKNKGFISFDISKYEGKILNLQITATRGGQTNIYINGDILHPVTFNSGSTNVVYNVATIGDLRPTRGLRFQGKMYDIAIYNRVLSNDEITHNWNYAKSKWHIN